MSAASRHIWLETRSIRAIINEAVKNSINMWHGWGGVYVGAFFAPLQPAIFGEQYYAIAGILMIAILILGNVIASFYFVEKVMGGKRLAALSIAFFMSFAMLEWMPAPVQGIYWFDGAVIYTPCFTGLMMLLVLMTEIQREFGKGRIQKILLLSLAMIAVSFLLGGGNQMCSFSGALGMFIIVAVSIYIKRDKRLAVLNVFLFLVMFAFFCLNALAPGNAVRQTIIQQRPSAVMAIILAVGYGCMYFLRWFSPSIMFVMLLSLPIAVPLVISFCKRSAFSFRLPLLVFVASVLWVCALFCPPLYALGIPFAKTRAGDYIYCSYIALLFFNEAYIIGFIYRTGIFDADNVRTMRCMYKAVGKINYHRRTEILSLLLLTVFTAVSGETLRIMKTTSTMRAIGSLLSGRAKRYSDENYERIKIYQASKGMDAAVQEFSKKPGLLFFSDIKEDKSHWINKGVSEYYGLNSVVLFKRGDE